MEKRHEEQHLSRRERIVALLDGGSGLAGVEDLGARKYHPPVADFIIPAIRGYSLLSPGNRKGCSGWDPVEGSVFGVQRECRSSAQGGLKLGLGPAYKNLVKGRRGDSSRSHSRARLNRWTRQIVHQSHCPTIRIVNLSLGRTGAGFGPSPW